MPLRRYIEKYIFVSFNILCSRFLHVTAVILYTIESWLYIFVVHEVRRIWKKKIQFRDTFSSLGLSRLLSVAVEILAFSPTVLFLLFIFFFLSLMFHVTKVEQYNRNNLWIKLILDIFAVEIIIVIVFLFLVFLFIFFSAFNFFIYAVGKIC